MRTLERALADYLQLRRFLGHDLADAARVLHGLVAFLDAAYRFDRIERQRPVKGLFQMPAGHRHPMGVHSGRSEGRICRT